MDWLYIALGLLPSIIWLLYFIRKDKNPEPGSLILKTFLIGAGSAVFAIFAGEFLHKQIALNFDPASFIYIILYYFIAVALIEELAKFLSVWFFSADSPAFNEPIDAMIYMVTAAMGFTAAENILSNYAQVVALTAQGATFITEHIVINSIYRFIMPTLLHALCSAIVGYFFAMTVFRNKKLFTLYGVLIATFIHGTYDVLSHAFDSTFQARYILAILMLLAITVYYVSRILFKKLRSQQIKEYKITWHFSQRKK